MKPLISNPGPRHCIFPCCLALCSLRCTSQLEAPYTDTIAPDQQKGFLLIHFFVFLRMWSFLFYLLITFMQYKSLFLVYICISLHKCVLMILKLKRHIVLLFPKTPVMLRFCHCPPAKLLAIHQPLFCFYNFAFSKMPYKRSCNLYLFESGFFNFV